MGVRPSRLSRAIGSIVAGAAGLLLPHPIEAAELAPRIHFHGRDITATTQRVALGQKIALTATEAGQTQSWTVSPRTVGGYVKGALVPTDFTGADTTFFWVTTGRMSVTYKVHRDGRNGTATATFDVAGPKSAGIVATLGDVQIAHSVEDGKTVDWLSFGDIAADATPGITLYKTGGSTAKPGQFVWAQLVVSSGWTFQWRSGGGEVCTVTPGLDNQFPYAIGDKSNDSPGLGLRSAWNYARRGSTYLTYLMWKSATPNSIPVPFGYVRWGWYGTAVAREPRQWELTNSINKSVSAFKPSREFPSWSHVVKNEDKADCH